MKGEKDLQQILKTLKPELHEGDYVFCSIHDNKEIKFEDVVGTFREKEGLTLVLKKEKADELNLQYSYVASWITLTVHSSLEAVGLTAAFASALSKEGISCNVIAAFYHDHIFVAKDDAVKAMEVLNHLTK
jgi:hypothetical protein